MIHFEKHRLLALKHMFKDLAEIACASTGADKDETISDLEKWSVRDLYCVLMKDDDRLIGYVIYGHVDKFVNWVYNMPLLMKLKSEGIVSAYTACHVHTIQEYRKGGYTAQMAKFYNEDILAKGGTHLLLWGYATDELMNYVLARPGSREYTDIKDHNGRRVGIRDIQVFVASYQK